MPFWDYLDERGIVSAFYDLPCDYPASESKHGHHCCLPGMGTPDMLGTYGTYQYFSEDGPAKTEDEQGGKRSRLSFDRDTAKAVLVGPDDGSVSREQGAGSREQGAKLIAHSSSLIEFLVHRDTAAGGAVIELPGPQILLRAGQWSPWVKLDFHLTAPLHLPESHASGICRFYVQEVAPNFRLYVSPINIDPSRPAVRMSAPEGFVREISDDLGLFATTGFQEDHKALSNGVFNEDEFIAQAQFVLDERLRLLDRALSHYGDGVLFFYFSSTDLQAHMLWWDADKKHPTKSATQVQRGFGHVRALYRKLDAVVGEIAGQYGQRAAIFVMSDHGFANFGRQFALNSWLRNEGYLGPRDCTSLYPAGPTWIGRKPGPTGWESTGCTSISAAVSATASWPPPRKKPCSASWQASWKPSAISTAAG